MKTVTVSDIRQVINDLPDDAVVLIKDHDQNDCEINFCSGAHDGRYGNVLQLGLGGYAESWNIPLAEENPRPAVETTSGRQSKMLKIMGMMESDKDQE